MSKTIVRFANKVVKQSNLEVEISNNMNEFDKMINGLLYNPTCKELQDKRNYVRNITYKYNKTKPKQIKKRQKLLSNVLGMCGENINIEPTIKFDYGCNTYIGNNFFANFDCKILDVCKVTIGNNVMLGSNVTLATPCHPLVASQRVPRKDSVLQWYNLEYGKPITIEDNVWLAAGVIVCGGVTISEGCVIGAGSVVTHDIPKNVFAAGIPCRVIREIDDSDYINLTNNEKE